MSNTKPYVHMHELAVIARQLDSVAQLVRALHRNRRTNSCIFRCCSWSGRSKMCKIYTVLQVNAFLISSVKRVNWKDRTQDHRDLQVNTNFVIALRICMARNHGIVYSTPELICI